MKVLIIGLYNNLGGIEKCIYDYISHMDLNGISIGFVGAPEHIWFEEELKKLGCVIHPVSVRGKVLCYYRNLCKIITENHYDVVHINMLSCANVIPLLAARKCDVKIICHSHASELPKMSLNFLMFCKNILHRFGKFFVQKISDKRLSCSIMAGKFLYGRHSDFIILPNAIDVENFSYSLSKRQNCRKKIQIGDKSIVIGYVARFDYGKNQEFAIKVFSEFLKMHPDSFLLLIGTGCLLEECKNQVKELRIEQKVIFCGQQNDIAPYLFAMDVFLFPSCFEGLGIAGIEAQCAGLPVIASKNISPEMAQTDLVTWCDLASPISEWTSAIEKKTKQILLRRSYAKELSEQGFDISTQAQSLKKIYESCVKLSR